MPSSAELPTIPRLLQAFHSSVGSERKTEDAHLGSFYDRMAGVGALCTRVLAERDQGEARALFFDAASGSRLDSYVSERYAVDVPQDVPGTGTAALARSTTGADTIYAGTRIQAVRGTGEAPRYWVVTADVPVDNSSTAATVPIEATVPGPAGQIGIAAGEGVALGLADRVSSTAWQVTRIDCAAGTLRPQDPEIRAGVRRGQIDNRVGYPTKIVAAMVAAGASVVALYQSDFLGDLLDFGLNRIYVGDAGYESPPALLTACRLAAPKVCVAGTAAQVLPVTNALLYPRITVRLWASPERLNQIQAQADAKAAVVEYFARRDNAFLWSAAAIRSAIMKVVPNVRGVDVDAQIASGGGLIPATEPDLATLFDTSPLPRYSATDWSVVVSVTGPG